MVRPVRTITVKPYMSFEEFKTKHTSAAFNASHFTDIAHEDCDVYGEEDGKRFLLVKFRKGVFGPDLLQLSRDCFEKAAMRARSYRKGAVASGIVDLADKKLQNTHTLLAGYWDRRDVSTTLLLKKNGMTKSAFGSEGFPWTVCRLTTFTRDKPELWAAGQPWLQAIAAAHKSLAPKEYALQLKAAKRVMPEFRIKDTAFTTVTVNHNWQTRTHTDSGDFEDGLGNLSVSGNENWTGGYLGFPRFRVALNMRPGDFCVMRVHEFHCNTPIKKTAPDGTRLSFVLYLRENMPLCKRTIKVDMEKEDREPVVLGLIRGGCGCQHA